MIFAARIQARVTAVVVVVAFAVLATGVTPARATTTLPAGTDAQCARFVQLRDVVLVVNGATTGRETLAAIKKATQAFRRAAAKAPEAIAEDMALLARSFSELDHALRPLASKLRPAADAKTYNDVLTRIRDVFSKWAAAQDAKALDAAQTAVDDWVKATCGFRLAPGDNTSTTTETTTPTTTDTTGR